MTYLLAHDLGTSGNKTVLYTEEGKLFKEATLGYPTHYSNNVWVEQNPADWWKAVVDGTKAVLEGINPTDIAAVSVSGHMNGVLCVDKAGVPLRPSIIWADMRAGKEYQAIRGEIDDDSIYHITGVMGNAVYTLPKLMWVRDHEPEIFSRTCKTLQCKDYILYKLTGSFATDPSDAGLTMAWDIRKNTWSDAMFRAAGIDSDKFPEVKDSASIMGKLTKDAALELGLLEGLPVVTGGGDGMMGTVGAGMAESGDAYVNFGTSSWVSAVTADPVFDPKQRTTNSPYLNGLYTIGGVMQSGGGAYSWCKSTLGAKECAIAAEQGGSTYQLLDNLAADSPPGSNGVIFLPQLVGERAPFWNADAKGAFIGLRMEHTRSDMVRAVLEGVIFNLALIVDIMRSNGTIIDKVVAIGGGATGAHWPQMLADAIDVIVLLPDAVEGATSMGTAMTAAVGVGIYPDFKSAIKKFVPISRKYEPDSVKTSIYKKSKELYLDCYNALEHLYPRFNTLGKA